MRETDQYSQLAGAERPKLEPVKKETPMIEAFGELAALQERTGVLLSQLHNRLGVALSPLSPEVNDKAEKAYPPHTCELHELAVVSLMRQVRINAQLQELIGRVAI